MTEWIKSWDLTHSPWLIALMSFAAYIIIAFIAAFFIKKVLKRLTKFTKSEIDDRIIDALYRPAYLTILFSGLLVSIQILPIAKETIVIFRQIISSLIVIFWTVGIISVTRMLIRNAVGKVFDLTGLSKDIIPLISSVARVIVIIAALMAVLAIWRVDITPVLASAGVASAAIAFAAKDTIANFFGGLSVFLDKPYKIGDYVVLDKDDRGEVVEVGIRSTRIKTRDDILITIPNSIIVNSKIINESAPYENFRVRIPVGVAYGSDVDLVEHILVECALANDNVVKEQEPRARFRSFGDSSLNFELLCWAKEPSLRGLTVHEINRDINRRFNEAGVTIPFPQRDVHFFNEQESKTGNKEPEE
ncbi:MAG: mechanosensitive ion channel family protein [Candidatus Kapaibacterium sp.]